MRLSWLIQLAATPPLGPFSEKLEYSMQFFSIPVLDAPSEHSVILIILI